MDVAASVRAREGDFAELVRAALDGDCCWHHVSGAHRNALQSLAAAALRSHGDNASELATCVFDTPFAFADTKSPYQSVVIVEFKRPERNEYPAREENPVEQVLRYVRRIKEGQAKDRDRRTINVGAIPFYAYILCSLTPRMRAIAEDHDFVRTPDNEGYFKYHQSQGCYIEIVSYDKVLNDAKKRNRAFFERLQIPAT